MITDFLHKSGEEKKGFVSNREWWIIRGSVKVQIFLSGSEESTDLIVAANLFKYPELNSEINEYVLKLNGTLKLKGMSFGIRNKHLILSYIYPIMGTDKGMLEWIVDNIAIIADEYDDLFIEKFNL